MASIDAPRGSASRRARPFEVALACAALSLASSCKKDVPHPHEEEPEVVLAEHVTPSSSSPEPSPPAATSTELAARPDVPLAKDEHADRCPANMLLVSGSYCPSVVQHCLEYHPEYVKSPNSPTVSDRCLRYEKPSRCIGSRTDMTFCMDRFEYPNRVGEMPRVLTSYLDAEGLCQAQGKRLCTEDEFNFACEGPESTPYATGYERDSSKCNYDREYRRPDLTRRMKKYDECPLDAHCKSELERLDQRHAIGSKLTCVSFAGIVDLNGNVNEWVTLPKQKAPHRSGLKGGWWGPVRDRCRPTVTFHKEGDYGYEAGFRCCAAAKEPTTKEGDTGQTQRRSEAR